jgi:hypothetical protein
MHIAHVRIQPKYINAHTHTQQTCAGVKCAGATRAISFTTSRLSVISPTENFVMTERMKRARRTSREMGPLSVRPYVTCQSSEKSRFDCSHKQEGIISYDPKQAF